MTQLPAARAATSKIHLFAPQLNSQELASHRLWIGVRIRALLDPYWQSSLPDAVMVEIVGDWVKALENYPPDEIRAACQAYLSGPDRRRKPKPGDILFLILEARRAAQRDRPQEAVEPPRPCLAPEDVEARKAFVRKTLAEVFGGKEAGT